MSRDRAIVRLVAVRDGPDSRVLDVEFRENGDVVFTGHDLGPATSPVSGDGEYEYGFTIQAGDVPRALSALEGRPGESIRDVLLRAFTGERAFGVRTILAEAGIETHLWTYS